MSQQRDIQGEMNQLSINCSDEQRNIMTTNIDIPSVPTTPPPTPNNSVSPSLADRKSIVRMSTGAIEGRKKVADVIDSLGRRRSSSCSEEFQIASKGVGFQPTVGGKNVRIRKSNSFFEGMESSIESFQVRTATDAKPTSTPINESMEICSEKIKGSVIARMAVDLESETYNMNHPRRGYFVILNHDTFDEEDLSRPGSQVDVEVLKTTAEFLGFQTVVCDNWHYDKIKTYISKLAEEDHSDADCLAIAVLTHGNERGYLYARDVLYPTDILWTPFTADQCPSLAGKPKIIFIQACRGVKVDSGVTLRRTETDAGAMSYKIPNKADFLICYSTVDGYYSWRNPENGTWYVQSLCEELRRLVPEGKDLLKIMVQVHAKVAFQYQSFNDKNPDFDEKKQIPSFVCMFTRDLYFTPKKNEVDMSEVQIS